MKVGVASRSFCDLSEREVVRVLDLVEKAVDEQPCFGDYYECEAKCKLAEACRYAWDLKYALMERYYGKG